MSTHLAFRARCAGRRGFTLVEAMVATAVFAVSIASVLGLSRWIVQATRANGRSAEAVNLAQAKIESFNHGFYSQVESGSDRVGLYNQT